MAIKVMCAVLDKAAGCFMQPFFVPAIGVAVRDFCEEAQKPDSPICKHAKDFSLYQLATFEDTDGSLIVPREPEFIIAANGLGSAATKEA